MDSAQNDDASMRPPPGVARERLRDMDAIAAEAQRGETPAAQQPQSARTACYEAGLRALKRVPPNCAV